MLASKINGVLLAWFMLFVLHGIATCYSQVTERAVGGGGAALGQTWICLSTPWAGVQNPAALAYSRATWAGVHHENRFMLKELGVSSVNALMPVEPGTFGFSVSHFGFTGFSATHAGLGYGMYLGKQVTAGVALNLFRMQLPDEYRSANAFLVEGGVHYMPTSRLTIGAYLFNPTHSEFDNLGDIPVTLGIGLAYHPSENILLTIQVDDDTQRLPALRGGIEYRLVNKTAFRLGYSSLSPEGITAGVGFPVGSFIIDFSLSHHQTLGFTPKLSVSYVFKRKIGLTE